MMHALTRAAVALLVTGGALAAQGRARPSRYEDLIRFFGEWRSLQRPKLTNNVPDYTATAMSAQRAQLAVLQQRLAAFDTTGWSIPQQIDVHIIKAEMNGLDFDHRVLKPWARNPAFYVTVFTDQSDQPAREGPLAYGALELWSYHFPLSSSDAAEVTAKLRTVPPLLAQAKRNLVGNAKDLWRMGIGAIGYQADEIAWLEKQPGTDASVLAEAKRAREATLEFKKWLEQQAPSKTGSSGIGIANYDWYLANVRLEPFTWQDEVTLMRRELARARALLALEEEHNRGQPALTPITSDEEWQRRFAASVTEYMNFMRTHNVLTLRDYMEPALRARAGTFAPGPREFFNEVNYRDPIVMLTHDFHWIDLAQMARSPHESPIRRGPLLYNIFTTRTEGFATAMEEMMTAAGFIDSHPRSKELVYVLVAQRAARALGDLMMHANRFTFDQSVAFATSETPRGWLRTDASTVYGEQHLYLQQPAYGTSYLIGKMEIERLLGDRRRQVGDAYTLRQFMDEFTAVGLIPMSLVRWELTGQRDGRAEGRGPRSEGRGR